MRGQHTKIGLIILLKIKDLYGFTIFVDAIDIDQIKEYHHETNFNDFNYSANGL